MKNSLFAIILILTFSSSLFAQELKQFTIYFDLNKYALTEDHNTELNESVLKFIQTNNIVSIELTGHTDTTGSMAYNQKLSERRVHAAKKYLNQYHVKDSIIIISAFGSTQPYFHNNSPVNMEKNRRVDIVVNYLNKEEDDSILVKKITYKSDTTIIGSQGTQLVMKMNTFAPHKISEVEFNIREVFTKTSMIVNNMHTMTTSNMPLISAGMVFSSAKIDDVNITPSQPVNIRIPAKNYDPEMKVYNIEVVDGDTLWSESDIPLNYNPIDGYYEFESNGLANHNLDKPRCPNMTDEEFVALNNQYRGGWFKEEGIVVKSRGFKYENTHFVSADKISILKGDQFKEKKTKFEFCEFDKESLVVSVAKKKDQLYFFIRPLSDTKYRKRVNRYIIRKKNYIKVDDLSEIVGRLDKIFDSIDANGMNASK